MHKNGLSEIYCLHKKSDFTVLPPRRKMFLFYTLKFDIVYDIISMYFYFS